MLTSSKFDQFDVIYAGRLMWVLSHAYQQIARLLGLCIGLRPWYKEYVPQSLHLVAANGATEVNVKKNQ